MALPKQSKRMLDPWITERACLISVSDSPSDEAIAQATAEYEAGGNLVSAKYFDPAVVLAERAQFGPALPCGWHGTKSGCRHGDNCHSGHGVVGVAAYLETLAERKARKESEAVNGVPLLNILNRPSRKKPCRYVRREGGCNKDTNCTYDHGKTPCKFFFSADGCNDESCEFSHEKLRCRHFFKRGGCRNGDACTYSHMLPELATKVKECPYFPSGCVNGTSCAYNAVGDTCAAVEA